MLTNKMKQIGIYGFPTVLSLGFPLYSLIKSKQYLESIFLVGLSISAVFIQLTQKNKDKSVIDPKYLSLLKVVNIALSVIIGLYNIQLYKSNPVKMIVKLLLPIANCATLFITKLQNKSAYYMTHEIINHLFNMTTYFIGY